MSSADRVDNHLAKSFLVTLFCCLPFGVIAIVHAASVDGKVASGDVAGAQEAAKKANYWANISLRLGILVILLSVAVNLLPLFLM